MNMLTQELVLQKYQSFDYHIRYLAHGVCPLPVPELDTVFALENGVGHGLVCDPLNRPLIFNTEAEAFDYRSQLGLTLPVLVFYEEEPEVSEAAMEELDFMDAATLAGLDDCLGEGL
jgi:hypothetical protein